MFAAPGHVRVDRAVRAAVAAGAPFQRVIITVNAGCRTSVRSALERHGDVVDAEFPLIGAIGAEIHSRDVETLAANGCVRVISADADVRASALPSGRAYPPSPEPCPSQTLISTLRDTLGLPHLAQSAPSVPTGRGVGVAIVDSGISPSDDFAGRISVFYDFTRGTGRKTSHPYDDFGHGTHIAGLIGSSGELSQGEFQGVAPGARLAVFKVLDKTGAGRTSDVIRAIEFIVANRAALDVHVINLSLGHPIFAPAAEDPLVRAVEQATAAGLVVVASAGNFGQKESDGTVGYAGITSPGNAPSAITVGAVMTKDTISRLDDEVAPYSSRGPTWYDARVKPDLVAPGHRLASDTNLSSYLYDALQQNRGRTLTGEPLLLLSGSSMAAAVTSGVVALALQAHEESRAGRWGAAPALTPNLVKGILQYSAITIDGADYLTQGAGQVNADGAVALARAIDTSRPIGAAWLGAIVPLSGIGGASYSWAGHVIYGDTVLAGDVLAANNIVWSTNIVWGSALREGDNIVWGTALREADNIVWGTNIVWGANIVWSTRVIGQRIDASAPTNIVWGADIVWGTLELDNIVWGTVVR
ncbi:MAG TPA: S8 family peptidase [Vicinamibacterales bacterium]|nr:S8 family peptidase [Vicinamibacterales bacterium]